MNPASFSTQQAIDEAACIRLCIDFANYIDTRRYDAWLDLFSDDGILDRMGTRVSGRTELAAFLKARPMNVETRHLCTNIRVQFESADEATGFCYVLFFQAVPGAPGEPAVSSKPPGVVEYHDRYLRTAGGWRIQERRVHLSLTS